MGRRKIEIEPLADDRNRTVTFLKRKAGLFKKAYELSVLCQVDLAVIIVGNNNKIYEFSSVDTKSLVDFYSQQSPHESKLPENYGKFKKRSHVLSGRISSVDENVLPDIGEELDSGTESDEAPDQKRVKLETSPKSIYTQRSNVNTRFSRLASRHQKAQDSDTYTSQRPVLRVQIPTYPKQQDPNPLNHSVPSESNARPISELLDKQSKDGEPIGSIPPSMGAPVDTSKFGGSKFKGLEGRKQAPQLPIPQSKLQTLSPSSAVGPQLPINSAGQYYALPPPSPSGQFNPAILPTPVFNLAFTLQYSGGMNSMHHPNASGGFAGGPSPSVGSNQPNGSAASLGGTSLLMKLLGGTENSSLTGGSSGSASLSSGLGSSSTGMIDGGTPKFKPPFQQQPLNNGEQTPISGLPSRYMNDIFPSPSNFYPQQDWPIGMTPFSSTMSHYFSNVPPASNGTTPLQANAPYGRNSLLSNNLRMAYQSQVPNNAVGLSTQDPNLGRAPSSEFAPTNSKISE